MKPEQRRAVPVAESQALRERSEAGVAPGQSCAVPGLRFEVSGSSYELECLADELQKWVDADESGGRKLVNSFLLDRILAYLKERQT